MSKCKCGRDLRKGEKLCPACMSSKSHRRRKLGSGLGAVCLMFLISIVTGGRAGRST